MITVEEIKRQISQNQNIFKDLLRAYHPDAWIGSGLEKQAAEIFKFLQNYKDRKPLYTGDDFVIWEKVAEGNISDIFECDNGQFAKCALESRYNSYIEKEINALTCMKTDNIYGKLFPCFVKKINIGGCYGFLYTVEQDFLPLSHWKKLDVRHIVWIFKRLMMVVGWAHQKGIIHGSICPDHILVNYKTHGITLIDWAFSGHIGYSPNMVPFKEGRPLDKNYTEETDIFMAASCMLPYVKHDILFRQFFESCITQRKELRPNNAWSLIDEMSELALRTFGKPKFIELEK